MFTLLSFLGFTVDPNSLVYYIRLALTVLLFGIFCKLGFDFVVLGLQVITGVVEKKTATRRAFEIFLPFLSYLIFHSCSLDGFLKLEYFRPFFIVYPDGIGCFCFCVFLCFKRLLVVS